MSNETDSSSTIQVGYDFIKNFMDTNYTMSTLKDGTIVYRNSDREIVGANSNGVITLYFSCSPKKVWNHNEHVMVGIAKDFPVFYKYSGKKSDIMIMRGMTGTPNLYVNKGYFIDEILNWNIRDEQLRSLGSFNKCTTIKSEKEKLSIDFKFGSLDGYDFPDGISIGILEYGKHEQTFTASREEFIEQFNRIKKDNSWFWEVGYNTAGSKEKRNRIDSLLQNGTNFHNTYQASINISNREIGIIKKGLNGKIKTSDVQGVITSLESSEPIVSSERGEGGEEVGD